MTYIHPPLHSFFVWYFGFEFVFERHHELDHVERVGTEVVEKCWVTTNY
jgi:hypothetical protein